MSRRVVGSVAFALLVIALSSTAGRAQAPSPLELVRGLREHGESKLALEYLRELDKKTLTAAEAEVVPLERARCVLEFVGEVPKAKGRAILLAEAKQAFEDFLKQTPNHPQALEALASLTRITLIEAKTQLRLAQAMPLPPPDAPEYDAALDAQREALQKARPLFLLTIKQSSEVAQQFKVRVQAAADPIARQDLIRQALEVDFVIALSRYYVAQTFPVATTGAKGTLDRDSFLSHAESNFSTIASGSPTLRITWVARAWLAEVHGELWQLTEMAAETARALSSPRVEAEEGKRLARFFMIRREYLRALTEDQSRLGLVETQLRAWLARYGSISSDEMTSVRYYLAFTLQRQAFITMAKTPPSKDGKPNIPAFARQKLEDAEKLYRVLGKSDNAYTDRAASHLALIGRRLRGEVEEKLPQAMLGVFESRKGATKARLLKDNGGNVESEKAVALGLAWIARQQKQDGGWEYDGTDKNERAGATGMALLAFLGAGETHTEKGKYQKTVADGVAFLVKLMPAQGANAGKLSGNMYAQGIATLALCEAYAMSRDKDLLPSAQLAVDYITKAQAPNGSWGYAPGSAGDTSITGWQIQALKAAQLSKDIKVHPATIKKAVGFLDLVSGGERKAVYGYNDNTGAAPGTSLTAVGLWCRYHIDGWGPNNAGMAEGVTGLLKRAPAKSTAMPEMYFHYYATQVVRNFGSEEWATWNEGVKSPDGTRKGGMRDWLVSLQNKKEGHLNEGSWDPDPGFVGKSCGRIGTTALAVMTLEVYYRSGGSSPK
ncbi:MAG: terpene cyclase/mutase family protein [Planctomycetes bacterium]|nr:terpene cyclase/mutase family protein [Planctomycetota bacterium]